MQSIHELAQLLDASHVKLIYKKSQPPQTKRSLTTAAARRDRAHTSATRAPPGSQRAPGKQARAPPPQTAAEQNAT